MKIIDKLDQALTKWAKEFEEDPRGILGPTWLGGARRGLTKIVPITMEVVENKIQFFYENKFLLQVRKDDKKDVVPEILKHLNHLSKKYSTLMLQFIDSDKKVIRSVPVTEKEKNKLDTGDWVYPARRWSS